jgi:hypothetical protein
MPDLDRRAEKRHRIWIDTVVKTPKKSLEVIATEISGGGIRIQSQKLIIPDTKIKATLKIDIKNEFYGKVLWALHKNQGTIAVYEIGIETDLIVMDNIKFNRHSAKANVLEEILSRT